MFAAVRLYLANIADSMGTVFILDDLQWAGLDALDLLMSLVRSTDTAASASAVRVSGQ